MPPTAQGGRDRTVTVRQQTLAINALRAHLLELGIIAAIDIAKVSGLVDIVRGQPYHSRR